MVSQVGQEVTPREKRELTQSEERTEAGRFFSPHTDIHETDRAVVVSMEVPGVDKNAIDIQLEKGVLTVKGTIDSTKYEALRPIYSEYNIGNFVRTFTVSPKIDASGIGATVADGVLTIELPKAKEALARRIAVS
jgi:HSP20 family protein